MSPETERLRAAITEARRVREEAIANKDVTKYEPLFAKLMAAVDAYNNHRHDEIKRLGLEIM